MRLATWNINGIRARLGFLLRWLEANTPTDPGPRPNYTEMLRRQGKAMLESFANAKIAVPAVALRSVFGEIADELLGSKYVLASALEREHYAFRFPDIDSALDACID